MSQPAVFFDRDNTLIAADGYLGDPEQVRLIDGAADAVARVRSLGYAVVTCSNQSGVARGYYDEDAVRAVNARMDALMQAFNPGAIVDHHTWCPFHPEATVEAYRQDSDLRKPHPGMLLKAAEKLDIDLRRSWLVGDAPRDIAAGRAAGCRTILFTDPALPRSAAADAPVAVEPDARVRTLSEAADIIADDDIPPVIAVSVPDAPHAAPVSPTAPIPASSDPPTAAPRVHAPSDLSAARLQEIVEQILVELKRSREQQHADFSVSKLLAGVSQILVFGVLFLAYLQRGEPGGIQSTLTVALILQTLTIALLIMDKQK